MGLLSWFLIFSLGGYVGASVAADPRQESARRFLLEAGSSKNNQCDITQPNRGIVIGITAPEGDRILIFGNPALSAASFFPFASLSKTFTAVLMNLLIEQGKLKLEDAANSVLAEPSLPDWNEAGSISQPIRISDLLSHRSGLPRLPPDFGGKDPYQGYAFPRLADQLRKVKLVSRPGNQVLYSNLGYAVLTALLEKIEKRPYAEILQARVLSPLEMKATSSDLADQKLVKGFNPDGTSAPPWHFTGGFAGAGGIRGTAGDLLKFVKLHIRAATLSSDLARAALRSQTVEKGAVVRGSWSFDARHRRYWHSGAVAGYSSFLAFDLRQRAGVVLLSQMNDGNYDTACLDQVAGNLLNDLEKPTMARDFPPGASRSRAVYRATLRH